MTREEIKKAMSDTKKEVVLKNLHKLLSLVEGYPEYEDCVGYAIEELEQEPILDKIRAEIENDWQLKKYPSSPFSCGLRRAIELIDKYKAESEEDNGKQASAIQEAKQKALVEACDSFKKDYKNHLKAAMTAMLEEFDLRLSEYEDADLIRVEYIRQDIQEKINALKGEEDDK